MFKLIKELFSLLTPNQRSRFYTLQTLVILMAITEIAGVASIVPFMALVGDMSLLQQDTLIAQVYNASGISTEAQFVFLLGVGVLVMLFLSALISMFTTWRLAMFAAKWAQKSPIACIAITSSSAGYSMRSAVALSSPNNLPMNRFV
ncbi:6TM ABC transporter family protein [Nitrincola tapanii]|uniref:ABC transporter ATP-binding protein n=1 Tax=Nitrincola tapanii TaxID=1708751 RepID=A0A5A9W4S7_9GAMM|nr:hypothetical protein [Nitrincola tapanii]KAA0875737.1 hypothetical protein E1H14_03345 [Nitrincola tapanii]